MPIAKFHDKRFGLQSERNVAYLEIFSAGRHMILMTFIYVEKLRGNGEDNGITTSLRSEKLTVFP